MSNMRAFVCLFFLAFAAQAQESSTSTTSPSSQTTVRTASTDSTESSLTSTTSPSSESTSSTESTDSTESSTTSTTMAANSTTTTAEQATGIVRGTLSFTVTSGNASDLVDDFENDADGAVASALATSIAAGPAGVSEENVTITSVALNPAERRVQAARIHLGRSLTVSESVMVEYTIAFFGSDGPSTAEEVVAALTSNNGTAAIESSLTTELQAIDPSMTIADIEVDAVAVSGSTSTTINVVVNFAARHCSWLGSVVLACIASSLLLQ
mmetsp:Transcript_47514/g.87304  ORF Transcript_47514/g.87304 Transcript_47514/m.87304 type:complete len:269 (-) Transcript_47514:213-1019(-)